MSEGGSTAIEYALGREIDICKPDQCDAHESGCYKSQPFQKLLHELLSHNLLTNSRRGTQHLVVHRFARKRDEKGMR